MERDRADRGLTAATATAHEAVTGLVPDGPVAVVNAEKERLRQIIGQADQDATRWEQAATTLHDMNRRHNAEHSVREQALRWATDLAHARPDLVATRDQVQHEKSELMATVERHAHERRETVNAVFSGELPRPGSPRADERARLACDRAVAVRRLLLDHIETLPVTEAATFILTRRAEAERRTAEQEAERTAQRRRNIFAPRHDPPRPNRSTPPLGP
jgi:hypothetical protein